MQVRPYFIAALVVALLLAANVAFAVLPGAVALAIPAIRTIFMNQGAIVAVGAGSAVRAVLPRVGTVAGVSVPMTAGRVISADSVAISALGVTGVAAGLITALAEDVDCRVGMSLECDPLMEPWPKDQYCGNWSGVTIQCGETMREVLEKVAQWANDTNFSDGPNTIYEFRFNSTGGGDPGGAIQQRPQWVNNCWPNCGYGPWGPHPFSTSYSTTRITACHSPSPGPADSDPAKCKTGNYLPATPAEAFERWKDKGTPIADPIGVAREAADAGAEFPGGTVTGPSGTPTTIDAPAPIIEGPATVTLPRTDSTSTGPDGTVTQVEKQPVANVTYEGDTYRWDIRTTTTTTVTPPGGSPAVTVTVETSAPPAEAPTPTPETPPEEPTDPCSFGPDRLGCIKLGDVPGDEVPTAERNIEFEPENLGSEGCPAPVPLGDGRSFSYQPLCDGLTSVRPFIIALGFLMAGAIMVAALRGAS